MVVDVKEIAFCLGRHAGQALDARGQPAEDLTLRGNRLAHRCEPAAHREDLRHLLVGRTLHDLGLDLLEPVVQDLEWGPEAVDEPVHDLVQDEHLVHALRECPPAARPGIVESRRLVLVHGDEKPLGVVAVNLDEPVLVGRPAEDDEEDVVLVVLEFRPLTEVE